MCVGVIWIYSYSKIFVNFTYIDIAFLSAISYIEDSPKSVMLDKMVPIDLGSVSDQFDGPWDSDSSLEIISEDGMENEIGDAVVEGLSILNNGTEMYEGDISVAMEPESVDGMQEIGSCASEGDADFLGLSLDSWLEMWREGKVLERYVVYFNY